MKYASHVLTFLHALIIILLMVVFFFSNAEAISWKNTNQITVAWDAVTTLNKNGETEPIPTNSTISYNVYVAPFTDKDSKIKAGDTSDLQFTLTLENEGKYLVGVQSVRKNTNGTKLSESAIGWSDDPEITANDEFGILRYFAPSVISGMQTK